MKKVSTSLTLMLSLFLVLNLSSFGAKAADNFLNVESVAEVSSTDLERIIRTRANNLEQYFATVSLNKLRQDDGGTAIKTGFENTQTQIATLGDIFRGLGSNSNLQVREYVYDQLLRVNNFQKASGFLATTALNTTFDSHSTPNAALKAKVDELKRKFK